MSKLILRQRNENTEDTQDKAALIPCLKLYGFMSGLFGRDSHGEKTIISVHEDHIIVKEDGHKIVSRLIDGATYTWTGVINDSNEGLEDLEEEECE